jgi:DNA-binding helix-hairpin-helix protein with protein kinase domain
MEGRIAARRIGLLPWGRALSRGAVRIYALRVLAVICAFQIGGLHWLAMQAMAWTGMLVKRTQETTVVEAVRTTFDGDHPCPLCQAVQDGQQREQESDMTVALEAVLKLNFLRPGVVALPAPSAAEVEYRDYVALGNLRMDSPPTPPPRLA